MPQREKNIIIFPIIELKKIEKPPKAKKRIMRESGISVVDSPADIGKTVKQILN